MKEELHRELAKLQEELDKLGTAVNHINDAKQLSKSVIENGKQIQQKYETQVKEIKEVVEQYEKLAKASDSLIEEVTKVNFPARLDKIDNTVSGINQGVQNVISKLENTGKELKEQETATRKLFQSHFKELTKSQSKGFIILYILIGILFVAQVISLFFQLN